MKRDGAMSSRLAKRYSLINGYPREEKRRMSKQRISVLMNQAVLALFGLLFCVLAIKKGLEESTGMILFVAGLVLLGLGIFRTWLVAHLIKKAEMTDENSSL